MTERKPPDDLSAAAVCQALGDRPARTYPALLSTHADALAWARSGAPSGAVVVADYQVSPRGRAGLEWFVQPGTGLGFSMVVHPALAVDREGYVYLAATAALPAVCSDLASDASLRWPDEVYADGRRMAAVGVHTELGPQQVQWAVVTVLLETAMPPRAPLLARATEALTSTMDADPETVLTHWRGSCDTLGQHVAARMIPLGPSGMVIEGTAVDVKADGALLVEPREHLRIAVLPHHLGLLDVQSLDDL
ncbi:hypothetical protein BH24ACT15_BH24ACT15_19630 [soil metagenome]